MKATKLILSILFIFSSVEGFSQTIQDAAICTKVGSKASFTVDYPTASTYVWQVKISTSSWITITSSNAGSVYSGYSSPTLNITKSSTTPFNGTLCRVIVNDGFNDLTSNVVTLTVNPLPVSKTITGASPVCIGGDITLIYGASSVGTIQWQSSPSPNSEDFYDIDGETLGSYTATGLEDTTWFRVKNSSGECGSVYSPAVQVVVNPLPVAGNIDGGDINVCSGSNTRTLTLYNHEGAIQWQKASEVAGSPGIPGTFANITSAILPDYSATNLTATTYFRAVLSSGVCTSETTESVAIRVDPLPISKLITGASAVCEGGNRMLTYGTGSVGDILWQYSTTSSLSDFYDLDGETEPTYTATDLQYTTWFRVMNTSGVCAPSYSPAVQVVVNPLPVAGNIDGGDINVCSGSNTRTLTLYNHEGAIQWQKASEVAGSPGIPGTFTNITSAILPDYSATNLTAATYFRAVLSSGVCTSEITESVAIRVDTLPISKLITGASAVCAGSDKTLTYDSTGSVGDIQWQYSTTGELDDFSDITGETERTYTATDLQDTTWFRVMNTSGACAPSYSPAVQVVVNPLPVAGNIDGGDINVCSGSNTTTLTLYNHEGAIQWQKAPTLTGIYSNIFLATSSTYTASALTATTYYRAVLSSGVCDIVYSPIVQIGVNVLPVFNPISPICNGSPMSPLPTISINGVSGAWSPAVNNTETTLYTFVPNGVCVNTTTITITVNTNTTAAPIGDVNQGFNMDVPKTISDLVAIGSNISWYTSIENALANTTPLELSTILVIGNTYYAMQTINGCSSTNPLSVKTYVDVNLGITDFDFKGLQFYPNPISDYFTIIYTERISTVQLFNTIGQSVFIANPNTLKTTLNVNFLPSGVYYVEVKANNNKGLLKVIKK